MATVRLAVQGGFLEKYSTRQPRDFGPPAGTPSARIAYAAPHMVSDPLTHNNPWEQPVVAWEATIKYRRHLWRHGLGVAEAMDTAHRGRGLDWPTALELVRLSIEASKDFPGARLVAGAGTDHLVPGSSQTLDDVIRGYETQCGEIEKLGGRIVLMASRGLARVATSPDDYVRIYGRILSQVREPVILHWLGDMFDPLLAAYWGRDDLDDATAVCLDIMRAHVDKVDGIKLSLLDKDREIALRRVLPEGVRMYTGDDFNYPDLIAGDDVGYSEALLGIFDPIAPAAGAALAALGQGDRGRYREILEPTVPLARHIFKAPTQFFKTGVVFMAYLNGHQPHFIMLAGQQSARSLPHLCEVFRLADQAGLLVDPDAAAERLKRLLAIYGVEE